MTLEHDVNQAFASALWHSGFAAADAFLGQGADVNRVTAFQEYRDRDLCDNTTTHLIETAAQGNVAACQYLLARGAHVNCAGAYSGRTALPVVELLLRHGADVLARDRDDGHAATDYAIAHHDVAMTRLLLVLQRRICDTLS